MYLSVDSFFYFERAFSFIGYLPFLPPRALSHYHFLYPGNPLVFVSLPDGILLFPHPPRDPSALRSPPPSTRLLKATYTHLLFGFWGGVFHFPPSNQIPLPGTPPLVIRANFWSASNRRECVHPFLAPSHSCAFFVNRRSFSGGPHPDFNSFLY